MDSSTCIRIPGAQNAIEVKQLFMTSKTGNYYSVGFIFILYGMKLNEIKNRPQTSSKKKRKKKSSVCLALLVSKVNHRGFEDFFLSLSLWFSEDSEGQLLQTNPAQPTL